MRSFVFLLCLAIASNGSPVLAGEIRSAERPFLAQAPGDEASQVGDVEARIAALESQRAEISTRGPRAAVITGSVLTGVGAGVAVVAGIACAAAAGGTSTQCKVENAVGLVAGGAVVAIAGLITLFRGRAKLRERNQQREVLDQEIDTLQKQRAEKKRPSVGIGMGRGNVPALVVGFQF